MFVQETVNDDSKNVVLSDIDPDTSEQKYEKAISFANVSDEDSHDNSPLANPCLKRQKNIEIDVNACPKSLENVFGKTISEEDFN